MNARSLNATLDEALPLDAGLDPAEVGGKAHTLGRVIGLGIPVPRGVVIPRHVFERWLDDTGLRTEICRLVATIDHTDLRMLQDAAMSIRALILAAPLPNHTAAVIRLIATDLLPDAPLVVRSSAVGEDGATASFAGQLDSILHVQTAADLRRAILTCWASYWSARVLFYQHARGTTLAGMGVIVQRQVPAIEAGVLFTRNPIGDPDSMLVESCAGLADGLVSGRIDPLRRTLTRDSENGDDLARTALRLEAAFGGPQDIEWARDGGGVLWIVQSRPITAAAATPPSSSAAPVIWSNANVCENFPGPISPLLYSIASVGYYHYFRNLGLAFGVSRHRIHRMDQPLRTIIGVHGARMYYNLTNIHAVLRLAPFGDQLAASFNEFVGAHDLTAPSPSTVVAHPRRARIAQACALVRIAACTTWQYLFFRRRLGSFEKIADTFVGRTRPELLATRSLAELAGLFAGFMDIRCHRWKNASLADAASMVCYSLLQRALTAAGAPRTMHNRLLRALPGVPSSEPPVRLWALSRLIRADEKLFRLFSTEPASAIHARVNGEQSFAGFRREFERYLEDWGFRSSAELMLTVPSLQEEPLPLVELLKQYAVSEGEAPEIKIARQAGERIAETRQLLRPLLFRSPFSAVTIWSLLRATQCAIGFRERARLKQALLYARCRRIALALGQRLVECGHLRERDDVFMLTWPEIEELAAGRAMFAGSVPELVALRRRQHQTLAASTPPDRLVLPPGASFCPSSLVADNEPEPAERGSGAKNMILLGTGACGGRITARAAVLADVDESSKLRRGDILVTRQTDPGWGPVFCLVSGLVIERGGMLSHGAIIAREFGLPCVVGIARASVVIHHGDTITVDGDAGTCTIDDPSAENGAHS